MTKLLSTTTVGVSPQTLDRPGWIPAEITHDWDTNPYAYQTEEELMAAGGLHGQLPAHIVEILRCCAFRPLPPMT